VHEAGAATVAADVVEGEAAADGLVEAVAAAVTALGVTAETALLLVTGLGPAPVTAGALVPAAPEVAEADAVSVTLRVFWLVTVIGAWLVPPTVTDTLEESMTLLLVVPPSAEAGADPAVAPRGTAPVPAVASPDAVTVELVVLFSVPPPLPALPLIEPS
jgi:hypothetical protein